MIREYASELDIQHEKQRGNNDLQPQQTLELLQLGWNVAAQLIVIKKS
jgi:hypothetical protein